MTHLHALFLCTHSSARSQMAEGFLRHLTGEGFEVASAGTEATRVHSAHRSKTVDALLGDPWDYVITVCDAANARCPLVPGRTTRLHRSVEDPSQAIGSEHQRLDAFRRVRDQIHVRVTDWLATRP
jgi:arsenate reductase